MGGMKFGAIPNIYNNTPGRKPTQQWQVTQITTNVPDHRTHTNRIKHYEKMFYCYTCGYDVGHAGYHCPMVKINKWGHNSNVLRNNAHTVHHDCIGGQQKILSNGSGVWAG